MLISKKGTQELWWWIVGGLIAIVAGILILIGFKGGADRGFGFFSDQFDQFDDYDSDGTINGQDRCPCTISGSSEHKDLKGCPSTYTEQQAKEDKTRANDGKCT